jgi:hypothetical protein
MVVSEQAINIEFDIEYFEAWIKGLRSDVYQQARGRLRIDNVAEYLVLGGEES